MIDDENSFLIAEEDCGSFLRIYIPGKVPNHQPTQTIKWVGIPQKPSSDSFKVAAQRFERSLKKNGLLDNLPQEQIDGYASYYPYATRAMATWEITPELTKLTYMRNDVAHNLQHSLWFPLLKRLKEGIKRYEYIQLEIPFLPKVTTEYFIQEWFENNQAAKSYTERLHQLSEKTIIQAVFEKGQVIYSATNHPFVNQPIKRFQIDLAKNTPPTAPTELELDTIRRQVLTRDIYRLKGLTDSERKRLHTQTDPILDAAYQIHWIQPLSLSGTIHKNNTILVKSDIEDLYRYSVQKPLEKFLVKYKKNILEQGIPAFIDIQVPYNDYRAEPIRKIKTKHQNRQRLKRLVEDAENYRDE